MLVENRDFFIPPCIRRPRSGGPRQNITIGPNVCCWKTRMLCLPDSKKSFTIIFIRFDRIPACDGRTDRQTDRRTDILRQHSPSYAYESRG